MFDPQKHIQNLADDAYQAGRDCAEAMVSAGTLADDEFLDQTRDALCGALLRAVKANAHYSPEVMPPVQMSAMSGFEDRRRELLGGAALEGPIPFADVPPEDAAAIEQVGEEIIVSMQPTGFDTGLFDKPAARSRAPRGPRLRGADGRFVQRGLSTE